MVRLVAACVLCPAIAAILQVGPISDREWKTWIDEVRPLLIAGEEKTAKKLSASDREEFRAAFWRRRDPDPSTLENESRTEFEHRVRNADKRFRVHAGGGWNDCGRTFVLLGKPDLTQDAVTARHFAAGDRLAAMREEDDTLGEIWIYRNPAFLPQSPQGYAFRFTRNCESLDGPSADRLLQRVAAAYVQER